MQQDSLFGGTALVDDLESVAFDRAPIERLDLGEGAWLDRSFGWLHGHETLMEALLNRGDWQCRQRVMWGQQMAVPRRLGKIETAQMPIIGEIGQWLVTRYGIECSRVSLNHYRDGNDSVAWHRDTFAGGQPQKLVALVALGAERPFRVRPVNGGRSWGFSSGAGTLVVMGGSMQTTWEHTLGKVASAGPRLSIMFRHEPPGGVALHTDEVWSTGASY